MFIAMFLTFLKIGFLGFGGGYAMLSLIYEESKVFGMTAAQFADLNVLDGLIPGPIAINSATYVGQMYGGYIMALVTTLAVSIPSLVFVPIFMKYEQNIQKNKFLNSILAHIKSASVGLIFAVGFMLLLSSAFGIESMNAWRNIVINWKSLLIILGVFGIHYKFDTNPIFLIVLAGLLGGIMHGF